MNAPMSSQPLPPPPPPPPHHFQPQMQPQQQNFSQQKHPGPQNHQSAQMPTQQKVAQGNRNAYANYDPKLALWVLEKPKNVESWEDVEPLKQPVAIQVLQNDLKKFRRNGQSVSKSLNEITSPNARRIISELVNEENISLWQYNPTIQWTIASVRIEWKEINRRKRIHRRIHIILETEPSGFRDTTPMKATNNMAGNPNGMQNPGKGNTMHMDQQHRPQAAPGGLGMGQQPKHMQPVGHNNFDSQQVRIPPPGQGGHGPMPMHGANLPPPPPDGGLGGLPPPPPAGIPVGLPKQGHQQQPKPMPGAFPESVTHPSKISHSTRPFPVEILDNHLLQNQKVRKSKHHHDETDESDSEWDSESSSDSNVIRVRTVEGGEYGLLKKRDRGRSRASHRSLRRHASRSRGRSASLGRHAIRVSNPYHRGSSRQRDPDLIEQVSMGKRSPHSSKNNSPKTSAAQLPAQVHIHMNTANNSGDDRRERRGSHNISPNGLKRDSFGKYDKIHTSHDMSRGSSYERGSHTGESSDGTSSVLTADDSVFSAPRSRIHGRTHSEVGAGAPVALRSRAFPRTPNEGFIYPHPAQLHDVDLRPRIRYLPANDYPHQDRPRHGGQYFDEPSWDNRRPGMPVRRNSMHVHTSHFDNRRHPQRTMSYNDDMDEPRFPPSQRYITDLAQSDTNAYNWQTVADVVDAMEHINHTRRQQPLKRRGPAAGRDMEWDNQYARGRGYDRYERY